MKDMSLEELLDDLCFYSDISDEHYKIQAEILRRFEVLGKENKELKQRDEVWREKKSLLENDLGKAWIEINNLKCCGNCDLFNAEDCKRKSKPFERHQPNEYCDQWQSDGLTREERKKK